jgi:surface carbohydrate biosynthesis protein
VHPRLVVTTIDNNVAFYRISRRHPDVKTLFSQNGRRGYFLDVFEHLDTLNPDAYDSFFVDYMLVFGATIGERYSRFLKGNVLLAGSIKNNFVSKENAPRLGMIAFVGHFRTDAGWHIGDKFFPFEDVWAGPDNLILQCLVRYAKEKNKRLIIIPSSHHSNELFIQEKDYFRKLMGSEPEFIEPRGPYPSYNAVDSSEVVVSLESTLGYESIARGTKTAIFSIRGTLLGLPDQKYGWPTEFPDEGPFWTNKPDPDIFVRILDYLFEVSDEKWKKDVETTNFSSIIKCDPGNTILQSILEKELGTPPLAH